MGVGCSLHYVILYFNHMLVGFFFLEVSLVVLSEAYALGSLVGYSSWLQEPRQVTQFLPLASLIRTSVPVALF